MKIILNGTILEGILYDQILLVSKNISHRYGYTHTNTHKHTYTHIRDMFTFLVSHES